MRNVKLKPVVAAFLLALLCGGSALAAPPAEVATLDWCTNTKNCLQWSSTPATTTYSVYRGSFNTLPDLLTPLTDSCLVGDFTATTTAATVLRVPAAGALDWYLVRATNTDGQGSAGNTSLGPRQQQSYGPCIPRLMINEVDYDQPGNDNDEFIEIYNPMSSSADLTGLAVVLINGASNLEYSRILLSGALGPGSFAVVSSPTVVLPFGTLAFSLPVSSNGIQNGAPDGIALFDTVNNVLIDALSYEGSITAAQIVGAPGTYNLVEGTPTTAADDNVSTALSLIRSPSGVDTDNAAVDWRTGTGLTPGSHNP